VPRLALSWRVEQHFELDGVDPLYSQGDTYEEAIRNIKDAIKLHIADRLADGEEIPQVSVSLSTVEIAV
jgi:predicted RNase H-like HicB family nuclease